MHTYKNNIKVGPTKIEPGSSVSTGAGDRTIEVRSSAETKEFFLWPLCPDWLWGPPSILYNGYRRSFPRG
jgi:hypothetical protein